jgi:hypothetical protein
MKRCAIVTLCAVTLLALGAAARTAADEPAKAAADPKPAPAEMANDIDLVICLDTSNSMDGLIDAAKQKLWDLVNTMAKAKPTPRLRVALYSYGNDGYDKANGWVRKELDFGTDLDMVFKKLFDLKTRGGTEYVARVCRDALRDLKWSDRPDALKLIFVCGNEPANQDGVVSLAAAAELASKNGVTINPIYCGNADDGDARTWRELAGLARGRYANIDQSQRVAIATPFDKKLAELATAVNATYVPCTKEGEAKLKFQQEQTANSLKLGVSNAAGRVVTQNSPFYRQGWDLVEKLKTDKNFDVAKIPEKDLPENLRKLTPAERTTYVKDMLQKREAIQKQVDDLARQRDGYLREEQRRNATQAQKRFDSVLQQTIREQAKTKGIQSPE